MNTTYDKQFLQFSIKTLLVATLAAGLFAFLMRLYGVRVIMPWALLCGIVCLLAIVGKWLTTSIRIAALNDPSTPKKITTFNTSYEANVFVAKLAEQGIAATAVGGFVSSFQAESPGYVDVVVPAKEYENAKSVADKIEKQKSAVV